MQRPHWIVRTIDPYEDAVYAFIARDSAQNDLVVRDTLHGLTIEIASVRGPYRETDTAFALVGEMYCYPLMMRNYGSGRQLVQRIWLQHNQEFSLPQSQFPITIDPGDSVALMVCVAPEFASDEVIHDSLVITNGCVETSILVQAMGETKDFTGVSRCRVPLDVRVYATQKGMQVMPNPADDYAKIAISRAVTVATVSVISANGTLVFQQQWQNSVPTTGLQVRTNSLAPGMYTIVLETEFGVQSSPIMIHR